MHGYKSASIKKKLLSELEIYQVKISLRNKGNEVAAKDDTTVERIIDHSRSDENAVIIGRVNAIDK